MADTIITNTPDSGNSSGGVALVVIIAVLVIGGIFLYQSGMLGSVSNPANSDTTEINVTVPTPAPIPTPEAAPAE